MPNRGLRSQVDGMAMYVFHWDWIRSIRCKEVKSAYWLSAAVNPRQPSLRACKVRRTNASPRSAARMLNAKLYDLIGPSIPKCCPKTSKFGAGPKITIIEETSQTTSTSDIFCHVLTYECFLSQCKTPRSLDDLVLKMMSIPGNPNFVDFHIPIRYQFFWHVLIIRVFFESMQNPRSLDDFVPEMQSIRYPELHPVSNSHQTSILPTHIAPTLATPQGSSSASQRRMLETIFGECGLRFGAWWTVMTSWINSCISVGKCSLCLSPLLSRYIHQLSLFLLFLPKRSQERCSRPQVTGCRLDWRSTCFNSWLHGSKLMFPLNVHFWPWDVWFWLYLKLGL